MRLKVDYVYGDINDIRSGTTYVQAKIPENADGYEQIKILKPLVFEKIGRDDFKIMSHEILD